MAQGTSDGQTGSDYSVVSDNSNLQIILGNNDGYTVGYHVASQDGYVFCQRTCKNIKKSLIVNNL
jgi:hypothetical protein